MDKVILVLIGICGVLMVIYILKTLIEWLESLEEKIKTKKQLKMNYYEYKKLAKNHVITVYKEYYSDDDELKDKIKQKNNTSLAKCVSSFPKIDQKAVKELIKNNNGNRIVFDNNGTLLSSLEKKESNKYAYISR